MSERSAGLLQLRDGDDVLVATRRLAAGELVRIGDRTVQVATEVPMGFKVAARPMIVGEVVCRYGMPIGVLTGDVAPGEVIHVHNLASRYLATDGKGKS